MKQKKEVRITLRLTQEQYDSIAAKAETAQMPVGAYVRAAALRHRVVVIDGLKELGVIDIFDARTADFTPLCPEEEGIFLSQAKHAARVKVDEQGIEAAAYTVMMAAGSAMPPDEEVDLVVDRPFLFVITSRTGLPLFAGVVNQV